MKHVRVHVDWHLCPLRHCYPSSPSLFHSATAGSVDRWTVDTYSWTSSADRFMDENNGIQVWGWTSWGGMGAYKLAEHRVYINAASGVLLREHQVC